MKDELIINIIGIVFPIFFVGLLILIFWRKGKKRTEQFALISAELKLNFFPKGSSSLLERLKPFHLFSQGWSRKIKNLMEGEANKVELAIFDYQYTTGGGKHSQTNRQSILFFAHRNFTYQTLTCDQKMFFIKLEVHSATKILTLKLIQYSPSLIFCEGMTRHQFADYSTMHC